MVDVISGGLTIGQGLPLNDSFFTVMGGAWLGIPVAGWIALALTVALTVILNKSRLGAMIRAVGSNRSAAVFSGIPELRLRVYCLMLTGGLAALSGVLTLAFDGGGDSTVGTGMELQAIAAAIIGGTAITGGTGSVPGGLIGALLVATINSALVFFQRGRVVGQRRHGSGNSDRGGQRCAAVATPDGAPRASPLTGLEHKPELA